MKKIYSVLFCFISIFSGLQNTNAQKGITAHFMQYNPYSNYENPALFTPLKGYVSFPFFSNMNISLINTGLRYNKLFQTDSENRPTTVTANTFVNSLSKYGNWLNLSLDEEILGFGFRAKRLFFSFSYRIKMDEYFRYSKDLFALPIMGNMNYVGNDNPADIDLNFSLRAYQEFSFGVQAEITKRLYIGVRPKFLIGMAAVKTNHLNAKLFTDPDTYEMKLQYNADIILLSAIPIAIGDNNKFHLETENLMQNWRSLFRNNGFACDIGALFRINENMGVAASLTDWGFINWKNKGVRFRSAIADGGQYYQDGSFYFSGLSQEEINKLINDEEYRNNIVDSLKVYFPYQVEEHSSITYLNAKFSVEYYYQINHRHRFSAFFQGSIINKNFFHRITLAYNGHFGKVFDLCGTYSIMPDSYANFGLGVGLRLGFAYLYLATDNIIGFITPLRTSHVNAQLGMVFKWGKTEEREFKKSDSAE